MDEGNITFVENYVPALKTGKYNINAKQLISITKDKKEDIALLTKKTLAVRGDRFVVAATDIDSVFPSINSEGEFSKCLAHIVLNRKTLPWEEALDNDPTHNAAPYLALLLFNENDPIPSLQEKTLQDLLHPADGIFFPLFDPKYGKQSLEEWESATDKCQVIDLPINLFNVIMPKFNDLIYLAHARQVSTVNKAVNISKSSQDFAVVIANRLPGIGKNTLHLVSLIGWKAFLPGESNNNILPQYKFTRLVSLKSWSFTNVSEKFNFSRVLSELDINPSGLQLSSLSISTTETEANQLLSNEFKMGYTLLPHKTRLNDQTISWYRSPLVPYIIKSQESEKMMLSQMDQMFSADALVYYDSDTSLLNISYAAAWQLGRLLAIQNKPFSDALFDWKRQVVLNTIQTANFSTSLVQASLEELKEAVKAPEKLVNKDMTNFAIPSIVIDWLAQLRLLIGVPFHYIVPDKKMLPIESMRFFCIDSKWIISLLNGAYSLGPITSMYRAHTYAFAQKIYEGVSVKARELRKKLLGITNDNQPKDSNLMTGFLLHSKAVHIWPGLEVSGYDHQENKLPLLRMEKLASNLLLCIFDGQIQKVTIQQPPESIHFGVDAANTLSFREGQKENALDISKLANDIKLNLKDKYSKFTSAEFGREMVEMVERVEFNIS